MNNRSEQFYISTQTERLAELMTQITGAAVDSEKAMLFALVTTIKMSEDLVEQNKPKKLNLNGKIPKGWCIK